MLSKKYLHNKTMLTMKVNKNKIGSADFILIGIVPCNIQWKGGAKQDIELLIPMKIDQGFRSRFMIGKRFGQAFMRTFFRDQSLKLMEKVEEYVEMLQTDRMLNNNEFIELYERA